MRVPTNRNFVPLTAQRLMTALDDCVQACKEPGDFFSTPATMLPHLSKKRPRRWDVLEELGLITRSGFGWKPTQIGLEVHAFCTAKWAFLEKSR